jgi:phage terminase large subunit
MIAVTMLDAFRDVLLGDTREKVLYGGSGSGKTHVCQQYAILRAMEEPNEQTLIVMETIPGCLTGMFYPMRDMLEAWGVPFEPRETVPMRIALPNGHELLFTSADKSEKLKHYTNVRRVIINEATGLRETDFNQLMNRMGRTYSGAEVLFTFNPIDEHHWIVERYVTPYLENRLPAGVAVHHSTYHDNPFLSAEWCQWLESRMSLDPNFYRVYALGLPGHLEGLIYTEFSAPERPWNWAHRPLEAFAVRGQPRAVGMDFGYNDPATAIAFWEDGTQRYAHELLYESGLIDDDLVSRLNVIFALNKWPKTVQLICDSARPDSIEKLNRNGFKARGTDKDIAFGIGEVKAKPLVVSDESTNLMRELRNYRWAEKSGKVIDKPVDAFNHALDGLRYAIVGAAEPVADSRRFRMVASR